MSSSTSKSTSPSSSSSSPTSSFSTRPRRPRRTAMSSSCLLCGQERASSASDALLSADGVAAHYFCMLFSSGLHQNGSAADGLRGFLPEDIRREARRGSRLRCSFCKLKLATVGCARAQCKRTYHLRCGIENGALQQHFGQFKSFCSKHRPRQSKPASSSSPSMCAVCHDSLSVAPASVSSPPSVSAATLAFPCCSGGAAHFTCVQTVATTAGGYHFRCPLCNDSSTFTAEMLRMGVFVPQQDAAWERDSVASAAAANSASDRTHGEDVIKRTCSAKVCFCPRGRRHDSSDGLWEVLGCSACGSSGGMHVACGGMEDYVDPAWSCYDCRRVAPVANEREAHRPLCLIWGTARATKSGLAPRSPEAERHSLLETIRGSVTPATRTGTFSNGRLPAGVRSCGNGLSALAVAAGAGAANVSTSDLTLEDIIVRGLDSCSSPGDSDYDSAHDAASGSSGCERNPPPEPGIPFKITKKVLPVARKTAAAAAVLASAMEEEQSFDLSVKRTIVDYFRTEEKDGIKEKNGIRK